MSHFSQIKTQIRNLDSLQSALTQLGIDWKAGPQPVRGYQGQTQTADVVVEQQNGYDIGFAWNGEQYNLIADLQYWQQPLTVDRFLSQVTQNYALNVVTETSANAGFQVAQQVKQQDGSIRLVMQRWQG